MLIVGVHLSQASRHSAVAVVRRLEALAGPFDEKARRWPTRIDFQVPYAHRWPKGARYGEIVDDVEALLAQLPERPRLLVNITATGRPPFEVMARRHMGPTAVQFIETGRAHKAPGTMMVPRPAVISALSLALGSGGFALPEDETLARQLEQYPASKPDADDEVEMAVAVGLAVWWGTARVGSQVPQPPPPRLPVKLKGLNEMTWNEVLALEKR